MSATTWETCGNMTYTGVLLQAGQVRYAAATADGQPPVPLLCLDLLINQALQIVLHVEQPFPALAHEGVQAAARRMHAGDVVTITTPVAGMRVSIRHPDIHIQRGPTPDEGQTHAAIRPQPTHQPTHQASCPQ